MIIPKSLKIGDTIGVIAPSSPIVGDNIEELDQAKEIIEKLGFKVKIQKIYFLIQIIIVQQQRRKQTI